MGRQPRKVCEEVKTDARHPDYVPPAFGRVTP